MKHIALQNLQKAFSGKIMTPEIEGYERASRTITHQGAPALILQPQSVSDIALAIAYARDNALTLSVRSGGHSVAGFGTNTGGVIIDLSQLSSIEIIDKAKHIVKIGGGALWGEVAAILQPHGLAISSGDTASVGVGGLTLNGGIGWMVRKYGLTIDSLLSAEVVTADGTLLRASQTENPDLFWAIRGGGGNFGIVTSLEFVAHPVGQVVSGAIIYSLDNLEQLLQGWRDYMQTAPEELTTTFVLMPPFAGNPPSAMVLCCFAGDDQTAAMQAIEPLLHFKKVLKNDVKLKEYREVLEEAHPPQGIRVIINNTLLPSLSNELTEVIAEQKGHILLQIRSIGGALNRVAPDATAFAYRDSQFLLVAPTFVPQPAANSDVVRALEPWQKIAAHCPDASYVGFLSEVTDHDITALYPDVTKKHLAKAKKRYDPQNIFNQNYNILPNTE